MRHGFGVLGSVMRRFIIASFLFLLSIQSSSAFIRGGSGGSQQATSFTPQWQALNLGAGGQITSLDYHSDGTLVIRTDTYGAYLYRSAGSCTNWGNTFTSPCWDQLVTSSSIPSPSFSANANTYPTEAGAIEIVACDSNTNVAYMLWEGFLYVTQNLKSSPPTWLKTTQTTTQTPNGGGYKDLGQFIACDPLNPAHAIIGTPAGAFETTNGTSGTPTFTQISTVLAPTSKTVIVAFDPTSSSRYMICSYGRGCYLTTNGGGNLALTTSTPTTFIHLVADKYSQFWLSDGSTTLRRYDTAWSSFTMPDGGTGIALDPNSASLGANKVAVSRSGSGNLMTNSTNGSGSWSGPDFGQTQSSTGAQPGWLNTANQVSAGVIQFNTLNIIYDSSSNIWAAGGLGVWTTPAPIAVVSTPWSSNNVGIEQLVVNQILAAPGVPPVVAVWDKGFFLSKNSDTFPSVYYNNSTSLDPIMGGWALDYAPGTVGFVAGVQSSNLDSSKTAFAKTTDGATNWSTWANQPSNNGLSFGSIAVGSSTNWLVHPACDGCAGGTRTPLYYTTNGAASAFTTVTVSGTPSFETGQAYRFPIAADRVTAGSYCAVDTNLNFYNTTNIASGLTAVATSSAVDGGANADMLVSVPGQAGTYMYTAAGPGTHLWKNTNSCVAANWVSCDSGFTNVLAVGFGATASGSGFPITYAWGTKGGVFGMYASTSASACASFSLINAPASQQIWPRGTIDFISWITGDPDIYGRVYVGYRGSGPTYIDLADACPYIAFSNIKPNDALTGASVTISAEHSGRVPVTGVAFYLDGVQIGSTQTGQTSYSVSLNASGQTPGAHTLKVQASGNGCALGGTGNSKSIPITTS